MSESQTITSMPQASQAIAEYQPPEYKGFKPRQVGWGQLPSLIETFNAQVLAAVKAYADDDEVDTAAVLSGVYDFATRLINLSCRIPLTPAGATDVSPLDCLSWSEGAHLFLLCLRVNLADLKGVVDFAKRELSGVLSVSPNSPSTPGSGPDSAATA
jgi:hypothetical protein